MPDQRSVQEVAEAVAANPAIGAIMACRQEVSCYLVGGSIRDLLLGREPLELDVVVEGEVGPIVAALGPAQAIHERFGTATLEIGGSRVDLARARTETYEHPGALPEVAPAGLPEDLSRRDFTINAMALPLDGEQLLDPHDGLGDLAAGRLRLLHDGSIRDDPTRALRAARYAARLGFDLDPASEALIRAADLDTVSADRVTAELGRIAAEDQAGRGFTLLAAWGLIDAVDQGLIDAVRSRVAAEPWSDLSDPVQAVLTAALGPLERARGLAGFSPDRPSEGVRLASAHNGVELVVARALGATWLDEWVEIWRHVRLSIDGNDLIAAGVEPGPALGRGLAAALEARLDGRVDSRDGELAIALAATAGAS